MELMNDGVDQLEQKWELVSSEPVFTSKWLTIEKRAYRLPNGEVREDYYHLNRPDYVLVLAVDDQDRVLVERQYRRGVDQFVYELPAGWIEEGETPLDAAIRELEEETGAKGEGNRTLEIYPQPGFSSMKAHVSLLKVCAVAEKHQDPDEAIKTEWIEVARIKEMVKDGKIKDMGFLSALTLLDYIKEEK